jgi:hypothetical protein
MPGTLLPVVDEGRMFKDQPDRAIILSRQITDVALFDRLAGAREHG